MKTTLSKTEMRNAVNSTLKLGEAPTEYRSYLEFDENGALLLPTDLKSDVEKAKKEKKSMKQYVDVIPVYTPSGVFSTEDEQAVGELINMENGNSSEDNFSLTGVRWELKTYGSLTAISEDDYNDTEIDMMKFFENVHSEKAARTENKLIFSGLREVLAPKTLSSIAALKTSLNKDLDPALEKEIVIVTNQDGFELFNKLDSNGQPINYFENDGPKRYFDIYRFEVYSNEELPTIDGKVPVLYGSFKRAVKFFTNKKMAARLFKNPWGLRVMKHVFRGVEEFDIKVIPDTKQVIYGEFSVEQGAE